MLSLELERGMDGVQGGFRFHVVEFSVWGSCVSESYGRTRRRNRSLQSPCQHENGPETLVPGPLLYQLLTSRSKTAHLAVGYGTSDRQGQGHQKGGQFPAMK